MEKEQRIRKSVAKFLGDRMVNVLKDKPAIYDDVNKALLAGAKRFLDDLVIAEEITMQKAYEIEQKFESSVHAPTQIKEYIEGVKNEWIDGKEPFEKSYASVIFQLNQQGINLPDFEKACLESLCFLERQENVISSLLAYDFPMNEFYPNYLRMALLEEFENKDDYVVTSRNKMRSAGVVSRILLQITNPDDLVLDLDKELLPLYEKYFVNDEADWIFN